MTQGVNMRTDVAAERDRFGSGTDLAFRNIVAMPLRQGHHERRVVRVVRHAGKVRLPEIVDFCF